MPIALSTSSKSLDLIKPALEVKYLKIWKIYWVESEEK